MMTLDELCDRSRAVVSNAGILCQQSDRLLHQVRRQCHLANDLRRDATALRTRIDRPATERRRSSRVPEAFVITGEVDGETAVARWTRRDGLDCSPELRRRAEIVVALGDTFGGRLGAAVRASLDGDGTAMMLTVLRAFSLVTSVDIVTGLVGDEGPAHV